MKKGIVHFLLCCSCSMILAQAPEKNFFSKQGLLQTLLIPKFVRQNSMITISQTDQISYLIKDLLQR